MSSMGELTFFLGLQIKQKQDGIFISQDKYVAKILKKFSLTDGKSASTPIDTEKPLLKDPDDEDMDVHTYKSMIGSLIYLTSSRPDIMLNVTAVSSKFLLFESIDCLPNKEIFTELLRMGYEKPSTKLTFYKEFFSPQWKFLIHTILQCMSAKRTSWNEFNSSMASAVICLSTGRKFNFSKYIFDSLVRNVDSFTKFYMYPRFLQLMIRAQVGDLSSHSTKHSSPALTQKVFANMRKVGKRFSGVDTPLFEGMIVAQQDDDVADEGAASVAVDDVLAAVDEPSIPSPTPTTQTPPPSQDLPSTSQVQPTTPPSPIVQPPLPQQQPQPSQPSHDAESLMDLLHTFLETWGIIANIDADEDVTLKDVVVVAKNVAAVKKTTEIKENDDVIDQVQRKEKEDNDVMRYQALKMKPQTEAQARKNMMIYLRNMAGFKMDYFKGMSYDDIRLIFEKKFNSNLAFLERQENKWKKKTAKH
nr:uncharacterized mitochondrial protein AtMg00810-like [Tanacetum cinerariifolium]